MLHYQNQWIPGAHAPVLDAALLARIRELNLDYLNLLAAESAAGGCGAQSAVLPQRVTLGIAALRAGSRQALASACYSLYSLGFEDEVFWRLVLETPPASSQRARCDEPQHSFCELAMMLAWHVANANPLAARLVYAMSEHTATRVGATPLGRMRRIANDHPHLLSPRWPTNPSFWPDLVRFAAAQDAPRLRTSQLLGHQLIAAELNCGAGHHGPALRPLLRLLRSPRLRARKRIELRIR